ncbi:hypothetical protein [Escherichia coli]
MSQPAASKTLKHAEH